MQWPVVLLTERLVNSLCVAAACTRLQICYCLHSRVVLLLLASIAADCTCLWRCCYYCYLHLSAVLLLHWSAVLLLLALVCSVALLAAVCRVAAACTGLQSCSYLYLSADLLLLALVCTLAATCTCPQFCTTCNGLQFCCCLPWSAVLLLLALICKVAGVKGRQRLNGTWMLTSPLLLLHTRIKAVKVKAGSMAKLLCQAAGWWQLQISRPPFWLSAHASLSSSFWPLMSNSKMQDNNSQTGVLMCRNWCEVREVAATADQLAQLQDDSSILITGLSVSHPKMSDRALLSVCAWVCRSVRRLLVCRLGVCHSAHALT